ncbi:MAG: hypothetical protein KGZ58_02830, partial [Ignavibacteriales bacterium]|nr:hypothetical protein [Ignavibacteriales bacterium]
NYTDDTIVFASQLEPMLQSIYEPKTLYRASGIAIAEFVDSRSVTENIFSSKKELKRLNLGAAIDTINKKFGKRSLIVGSSVLLHKQEEGRVEQNEEQISYRGRFISL